MPEDKPKIGITVSRTPSKSNFTAKPMESKQVPFSHWYVRWLKFTWHSLAIFGSFGVVLAIVALCIRETRPHFISFIYRSLLAFVISQGTNTWGFASSNIIGPALTLVFFIIILRQSHGEDAMKSHWKRDGIIGLRALLLVLVFYYFPLFLWKGIVRTVYDDHYSLVEDNHRLRNLPPKIQTVTVTADIPQESQNSLRRRTVRLCNELDAFLTKRWERWSQTPRNQNDATNQQYKDFSIETEQQYVNQFRQRALEIVKSLEAKGLDVGTIGAEFGAVKRAPTTDEIEHLRNLAWHLDANDSVIHF